MSSDASASLSADIQRVLEQAIGDANSAAEATRKKKSKRARESSVTSGDTEPTKKRKKKSKTHASQDASPSDGAVTPAEVAGAPGGEGEASDESRRKKKSKKGKEREVVSAESIQPAAQDVQTMAQAEAEAASNADIAASSADFLRAVVAAASATAGQPPPGQPTYDPSMPPPHFLPYAPPPEFPHFPYPPPGHSSDRVSETFAPHSGGPMYADPHGMLPPDFHNFASSEELLRSLPEFDLNKVMHVLRSLGDAASVSVTLPPNVAPSAAPPPVVNKPVLSEAILGRPRRQAQVPPVPLPQPGYVQRPAVVMPPQSVPVYHQPPAPPSPPSPPPPAPTPGLEGNPEHAHMLANMWMNAQKLAEMVKKEGLVYKKGKFSAIEEAQLNTAIEHYRVSKGLTQDQLNDLIFSKEKGRDTFWQEITSALHLRPINAVYHHVRRNRHPLSQQGKWTKTEDEVLIQGVAEFGQHWERVSIRVGRMAGDCRDRWRNHLEDRGTRRMGSWSTEEEAELTRIVTEMTVEKGRDVDSEVFWGIVSQRMGGKRGRQQCRIKWTDTLSSQIKNSGEKPRWSQLDAYILVHKVDSLNVRDDTEIDWKLLPDEDWKVWSAHALQRRWLTMKRGIKGHEEMSHAEVMEILKTKKSHIPSPCASRKKKSKVTSAEAVVDLDDVDGNMMPIAGPSSGVSMASGI